eukprot:Transcript_2512.p3 GENE.Transcript_2512~~Transcript_2512.p3  ORF type:complete len:128 (+),score=51.06 Transcript_2512:1-384(+)
MLYAASAPVLEGAAYNMILPGETGAAAAAEDESGGDGAGGGGGDGAGAGMQASRPLGEHAAAYGAQLAPFPPPPTADDEGEEASAATPPGGGKPARERLLALRTLLTESLISEAEYEERRKKILEDI